MSKIDEVEQEFGIPFDDVVRGFAEDGESMRQTGFILGWSSTSAFCSLMHKRGLRDLFRPYQETNAWAESRKRYEMTPARRESLRKAQEANGRYAEIKYKGVVDTISGHARRSGVLPRIALRRWQMHRDDWPLEKIFSTRDYRYKSGEWSKRA